MIIQIESILDCLPQGVAVLDDNLDIVLANPILVGMLCAGDQKPFNGVLKNLLRASSFISSANASGRRNAWRRRLALREAFSDILRLDNGSQITAAYRPLPEGGWLIAVGETDLDIRAAFVLQSQRLDVALAHTPHGLCMFDSDKRLILCNSAYGRLYGLPSALTRPGTPLDAILQYRKSVGNDPAHLDTYFDVTLEAALRGGIATTEVKLADGRTIRICHNPMLEGGYVATHEDITQSVKAAEQIVLMARLDPLTGLCNRGLLLERLEHELTFSRNVRPLAVGCIDLDHFKEVNDLLGHPVGDALLKAVTERIQGCLREGDTLARFGGDEFVVLMADVASRAEAGTVAERIIHSVAQPYMINGNHIEIGVSIGMTLSQEDADTADLLISHADMALYRAKADGRGIYRFFENEMDDRMQERNRLENELRDALRLEQFEIHYQPQINVQTKALLGFEALLRWRHPDRGLLLPDAFIPLAEETGLIGTIGEWVVRRACRDAAAWPGGLLVAVNVSPVQFKSRTLAHMIVSALAESGLAPGRLELEITESVLFTENAFAMAALHQMKSLGVRIAMDDFGNGYSSLNYLRLFPFDKIKIDRSFVNELSQEGDAAAIVRAVIALGASLGIATTAEGVETEEQMQALHAQGCHEAQGFLVGRPMPESEIRRFFPEIPSVPASRRKGMRARASGGRS